MDLIAVERARSWRSVLFFLSSQAFESSTCAIFETMLAPAAISDQPMFQIQGTLGEIIIDGFEGGCTVHTLGKGDVKVAKQICHEGWDASYVGE
jgi:hypothetical protein